MEQIKHAPKKHAEDPDSYETPSRVNYHLSSPSTMENIYYFVFVLPLLLILIKHFFHRNRNLPPTPFALPIIGHLHHLIKNSPHQALDRLSSKYGPILFLQLGSRPTLIVSSPSAVEECFTKNDIVFANRPPSMSKDYLTYNSTMLVWASYGHLWRVLRRITFIELFSSKSLRKFSFIREDETGKLISHLFRFSSNSVTQKVELKYWFTHVTFNIIMRMVNGESCIRDEVAGKEEGKRLLEGLKEIFLSGSVVNLGDYIPFLRWVDYKGQKKSLMKLHKKRDEFLQGLIDEFRRKRVSSDDKSTLIGTLLCLQESEPDFYSDDLIKSIILVLFIAGTGTSAITMEKAMSLLLHHPEALKKVRAEIDNQVGHGCFLNDLDLTHLPYLHCVINETLRLYPPVPLLLPHYSSEHCTIGGFEVPKGTTLMVNAWAMHRDPKVWEEPNGFKPERFEKEKEGFKFVPFGMGRRMCPGANMGIRAISLVVGTLVQCFELENVGHTKRDMNQGCKDLFLQPEDLEVVCVPRKNALHLLSQI